MPKNLTRVLLAAHRRAGTLEPGADLVVDVARLALEAATPQLGTVLASRGSTVAGDA